MTLYNGGARVSELASLIVRDLDIDRANSASEVTSPP